MAGTESHDRCPEILRERMANLGVEATVSTAPPLIRGPYETCALTCPHGTTFYMEPTSEQIAAWARDGVR